jgi:hypothetical protein
VVRGRVKGFRIRSQVSPLEIGTCGRQLEAVPSP